MSFVPPPGDDVSFIARFTPEYKTLILDTDGNGSTIPSIQTEVQSGIATQINAIPNDKYYFKNWSVVSGDATFTNPTLASDTVTITADATIMANFDTKLITVENISDDTPGIGIELHNDGKIYCFVVDARETGNTDQLDYNASVSSINSTIAIFDTTNINFYDGGYHNILFEWSIENDNSREGILYMSWL